MKAYSAPDKPEHILKPVVTVKNNKTNRSMKRYQASPFSACLYEFLNKQENNFMIWDYPTFMVCYGSKVIIENGLVTIGNFSAQI